MRKEMKSGYTTGSCAAAGTKAAILALQGNVVQEIELYALSGELLHIPIKKCRAYINWSKSRSHKRCW